VHESAHIVYHPLPALLVLWPLISAAFVYPLGRWRESVRDAFVVLASGVTLLGAVALIPLISTHHKIAADIPALLGRLHFVVDPYSMLFALFSAFVWFCATLYSLDYLKHEQKRDRYHTVNLVVLSAMLGVVLAGDLVTLYLFFEALGLVAFLFVIHTETEEAKTASVKYWWMTLIGGFALLGGILLTYALGHTGAIGPIPLTGTTEALRWATFGLLILGFGVKAGMLPVHVWLPDAHPVAPSPASALLSGVMIKAGAYGIFRTVTALFRPEVVENVSEELWHMSSDFGLVVLWIGIATMIVGVTLALGQSNAKRMLAYHSVSQMGFILTGIGAAGYLGAHGALGVAGGLMHVLNHALFKSALFLGVGAVFYRTGELDMYKLGGLWRKMPLTFVFMVIAAAGITGVPLFNGFVSKCLIHHALVESFELHHVFSLSVAEKVYMLTCGGTACSFIKLISFVFLGRAKTQYGPEVREAPPRMLVALGLLSAAIIAIGVRPQVLLKGVIAPGLHAWALHSDLIDHYLAESFLGLSDIMSVVIAFVIGSVIFVAGMRFGLFHLHAPKWLSINYYYLGFSRAFVAGCVNVAEWYARWLAWASHTLRSLRLAYRSAYARAARNWQRIIATISTGAPGPRNQHFIQRAYVALERERQSTVRAAVSNAHAWLRTRPDVDPEVARATVESVRDIASYMAQRQRDQRMTVLAEMVRTGEIETARYRFDDALMEVRSFRTHVAHTAIEMAERRMAGEDVVRDISAEVNRISSEERFDIRLREGRRTIRPVLTTPYQLTTRTHDLAAAPAVLAEWRVRGLGRFERAARWVVEIVRVVVEATTQERSSWLMSDHIDAESVLATRKRIQRYARDMSLNMAVIIAMMLVFLLSIAVTMNR
jgi:formate hydrogenlyase subunit 3/multisubunit Na+/H+ antiporter MnhD subunit